MRAMFSRSGRLFLAVGMLIGLGAPLGSGAGASLAAAPLQQEPQWIWSPADEHNPNAIGGTCYFRRIFDLTQPESGEVQITADESYELFVNGRQVAGGKNWRVLDVHDVTKYLTPGRNVVAIKATKTTAGPAGIAARVLVKAAGNTSVGYLSNASWRTSRQEFPQWSAARFNDVQWLPARMIGQLGVVKPWLDEVQTAGGAGSGRFTIAREFRVEPVASPKETGSLLTMAFNEFGEILAAREEGPLLLLRSSPPGGLTDKATVFCDKVKNVQGILPLNGQVFVIGAGPEGSGLYRISDSDDADATSDPPRDGAKSEPAKPEKPESLKSDSKKSDSTKPERIKSVPAKPHALKAEPIEDDATTGDKDHPDADKNEPTKGANGKKIDRMLAPVSYLEYKDAAPKKVELLLKFTGEMVEHGPHVPVLGPDGLIYVLIGDHTKVEKPDDPASPHHHYYEGDLVGPRYEDPNGYGVGVKAPGGQILRTDIDGKIVEVFAGGLRNPYSMTFSRGGELFTSDSDMEWDIGLPWYRPTRALHVVPGGEYGWRSGWAVWPEYYFDSLPAVANTGPGSPTGMVAYNHVMFPRRFHDSLFVGDWARGRILNLKLKSHGAGFTATSSVFLEGKPLNITGLGVGPDGNLYFCAGGRETEGGVYRIVWSGQVPDELTKLPEGVAGAVRQPQIDSAWGRQTVATIKQKLGADWDRQIKLYVMNAKNTSDTRCRALDLMQLVGPFPSTKQLVQLSRDVDADLRAKAVYLMGLHADDSTQTRLVELLHDTSPAVQRLACESLARAGQQAAWLDLAPLLKSNDRFVAWSATRLLERLPKQDWQEQALKTSHARVFIQGALAMLVVDPDRATAEAVLARAQTLMASYLSDGDFLDVLRVMQLALERGKIAPADAVDLRKRLADEYPSKDRVLNRELVRLLAYLQDNSANERIVEQLQSDLPLEEKLHLALYARFIPEWSTQQKLALLKFFETARAIKGGHSYAGYIENTSRDFFAGLTEAERKLVLADGVKWPSSALSVLAKLPDHPDADTLRQIEQLDRRMSRVDGEPAQKLGIGIVAVLGHSGDPAAMRYLRDVYQKDPERRGYIAMSLAEYPDAENWPLLVQSLSTVDGAFAQQVLTKLATVDKTPEGPEPIRQAILRGLKLKENGGQLAIALLEKWTSKKVGEPQDSFDAKLASWQKWFAETYPDQPEAKLPEDSTANRWTSEELISFLNSADGGKGNAQRGAVVYAKAQCIKCHRFGERGDGIGPDLTTVSRRFQKREILESVLFPSQVISDQYASKSVLRTDGRTVWGLVAEQADGSLVVTQSDATKVSVAKDEIDAVTPIKKSAMPEGLLNTLTLEEIADLFAYLNQTPDTKVTRRPAIVTPH